MLDNMMQQGTYHIYLKEKKTKKLNIAIEDAHNRMIVAEDVYNKMGAVVVGVNSVLDENIINRLKRIGIHELKVFEKSNSAEETEMEKYFMEQYAVNIVLISEIMKDIQEGKAVDEKKLELVTASILEKKVDYINIINGLYKNESFSRYEYTHSVNVSLLSVLIGRGLGLSGKRLELMVKTALMHDIGKCKISEAILNKRGKLTAEEFTEIKRHPHYSAEILKDLNWFHGESVHGVLMHHEREDGSGYPQGLKGESIVEFAKIIAVADVFDAMTSDKAYSYKANPFDVFEYLDTEARDKMNPRVISAFLQNAAECYVGDVFFLNNGQQCEIIHINPAKVSKPIVRISDMYVDLSKDENYKIEKIV
jgi:HD-GYP domain-containing protein (c-di-GMP phosphodiesterase class II)